MKGHWAHVFPGKRRFRLPEEASRPRSALSGRNLPSVRPKGYTTESGGRVAPTVALALCRETMRAGVRLTWGRPIDLSEFYGRQRDREVLKMLTKRLLTEIALLAGEAGYRPELAGRFYKPGSA